MSRRAGVRSEVQLHPDHDRLAELEMVGRPVRARDDAACHLTVECTAPLWRWEARRECWTFVSLPRVARPLGRSRPRRAHAEGMRTEVSIGVAGALGPEAVRVLAPRVESAGFAGLWLNDSPQGDSLAGLAAAAEVTTHLRLATGVIPIDRRPATAVLADLARSGVPEARLTLGIGSGQLRHGAVQAVATELSALRDGTAAGIVIGALGPRMRRLAAEHADGALLSWLPPDVAATQAQELRDAGLQAQGERPRVALYARTIVDDSARPVLEHEASQYASYPTYAANFERLGISAMDTTLPRHGDDLASGVAAYAGIDELVLRAITPTGSLDDLLAFVDEAAARLG